MARWTSAPWLRRPEANGYKEDHLRRRGEIPNTFCDISCTLVEEVEQQLKTVYGFTLRSRKKSGPVEPLKYPTRRRTFIGGGNVRRETMDKEQVEMEKKLNSRVTGALYNTTSKPVSHQELLDGDERAKLLPLWLDKKIQVAMVAKRAGRWWCCVSFRNRFSNRGQPNGIDRIYEVG